MEPSDATRLIVGAEASGLADEAVRAALELAHRLPARLEILHAVELPPREWLQLAPADPDETAREVLAARRRDLEEHLQGLLDAAGDAGASMKAAELLELRRGPPAEVLVARARELSAALVVLGPHRRHGLLDFGGTARALLAEAPCDLWVQAGPHRPIERLLVPVDLSVRSLEALHRAVALAARLGARITALHCHQAPALMYAPTNLGYPILGPGFDEDGLRRFVEQRFREVMATCEWKGVPHEDRFVEGEAVSVIRELEDEHDLVALGTHGRTGLSRAVLGSVAYSVLKHARVPVLAVRGPARSWRLDRAEA